MIRVQDVLLSASEQGVYFYLKDSNLVLRAKKNTLSPELKEQIRQHKSQIIEYLENAADKRQTVILPPVLPANRNQALPLSFAQQRLWFIDQLGGGSAQYNLSHSFILRGEFHENAFKQALKGLLTRHEVLRTQFVEQDGEPRQVIVEDYELPFTRHDLTQLVVEDKAVEAQRLIEEQSQRPFDLQSDLMLRVGWLQLAANVHLIVFTMHHIVSDAWSRVIFQRELSALYAACRQGEPNPLPPLPIQYADYAVWQRQWLEGEVLEQALSYWKKQLAGLPAVHSLPLDKLRPTEQRHRGKTHTLLIGPKLAARITELNRRQNTTLFMFMHTAFALLLSRWSGERDIVVGGAITGRMHRDVEGLIGFFINDLVLRLRIDGTPGFTELLKQHRETILDAYANQHIPFEMLVEELNPERSLSYSPLYQIKLDVQNNDEAKLSLVDLELLNAPPEAEVPSRQQSEYEHTVRHDLYVSVSEQSNGMSVIWAYNADLFAPETIARWSGHFETLLEGIVAAPHESVYRLALLTPVQQQSLLIAGRGPQVTYPHGKCIHQLFEEQVERSPEEPAVVARDGTLTFRQLNEQANRLAHYLLARGAGPGSRVALCTERSIDMVVGLLGILKAGGAYLPLDPAHPPARLEYMLEDSGCRWVLTQGELMSAVSLGERQVLPIDASLRASLLKDYSENDPVLEGRGLTSRHLAYVIYTSGSTGQPKGVMVEHEGVVRYCDHARERYYGSDLAGSLVATSYGFDLTVPALYVPLLAGGHLRLVQEGRELEELAEILVNAPQPYLLRVTPSHVTGMLPLLAGKSSACAHALVIGGEALPVAVVKALRACLPQAKIYNHYGPTEAIVGCSLLPLAESEEQSWNSGYCPIGTALGHKQLLVLNGEMQLQPVGAPGQLYVGGEALSRGYLGQPALTAQKFSSDLFSECVGARLYATGDLVRWRTDGNLEFLGRLDQQVKIRGLRIGLGEIEQGLLELPGVRECAVTVSGVAEQQRLVAYVVPEEDPAKDAEDEAALVQRKARLIEEYREALGSRLPAYMVPQVYVFLPRLPLTLNGKLDREALPAPEESDLVKSRYVAPRNATEQKLCALWQEVLKVAEVGIEDNFFLLGGHSLLATRLLNLIRQEFATELPLRVLFEAPTVAALSERLEDPPTGFALPPVTPVPRDQPLPLSYAQQRLWFIDQLGEGSAQYNIADRYFLHEEFRENAFERALRTLIDRHEVLRTHIKTMNGEPRQVIVQEYELPFARHDLSMLTDGEKAAEAQRLMRHEAARPFDLGADLMLRVRWLKLSNEQHLILYTMHHIASDGWSKEILQNELSALYEAYGNDQPNPLQPQKLQYADYALWQRNWLKGEVLEKQLGYWRKQLSGIPVLHALPLDYPRPLRQTFEGRRLSRVLGRALTERIRALCEAREVTLFMFLQTAFAVLLGRYSNATDIVMGSPIAGRTHKDVEGVIGFFINTLVLRTNLSNNLTFGELLETNKQVILDAYANQHIPFDMLVDELNPERSLSHNPLTQISLTLQNNEKGTFGGKALHVTPAPGDVEETAPTRSVHTNARVDLELYVTEANDTLSLGWHYNQALFRGETVVRMAASFEVLLNNILDTANKRVELRKGSSSRLRPRTDRFPRQDAAWVLEAHLPLSARPSTVLRTASEGQKRQWCLSRRDDARSTGPNITCSWRLQGDLDVTLLEQGVQLVVSRHETLRTHFEERDGRLVLGTSPPAEFALSQEAVESEKALAGIQEAEKRFPFDMSRGNLCRLRLLKEANGGDVLLLTLHRSISDEFSAEIFIHELAEFYRMLKRRDLPPMSLSLQYADCVYWQQRWLEERKFVPQMTYWREQLADLPMLSLPANRLRTDVSQMGARRVHVLPSALSVRLRTLADSNGVSFPTVLMSVLGVVLSTYARQYDFAIATRTPNRRFPGTRKLIAPLANTLLLRMDLHGDPRLSEVLKATQETTAQAYEHQDLPFETIVQELYRPAYESRVPVCPVLFELHNQRLPMPIEGLAITAANTGSCVLDRETSCEYDLSFVMSESRAGTIVTVEYKTELFDSSFIERLLCNYERFLESAVVYPDGRLSSLELIESQVWRLDVLGREETLRLLQIDHDQPLAHTLDNCIHELFEKAASEQPDAIALSLDECYLSYEELSRRSSTLASYLRRQGIGPNVRVGACLERSIDMIVSLLGILKAGGCFVPLDPTYPAERLRYLLENAAPALLLTHSDLVGWLPESAARCLMLDAMWGAVVESSQGSTDLDRGRSSSRDLAYVIYTSGSTGQPKGVMVEHASACNLAAFERAALGVGRGSRVLQFSSPSFDASIWEYLMALCSGACLQLASREQMLPGPALTKLLVEKEITHLTLPSSALRVLSAEELDERLQTLIVAGEACPADLVKQWASGRMFVNGYGPTEATVCATMHLCDATQDGAPPIGRPIANTRIYIVDRHLRPVPVGVEGEIYIAGAGIARGYLNRAALTAERFVPDSFVENDGARMYRTGDLGRWRAEGTVEFLGRTDDQVKLRGYRIELREIEQRLLELPGVRECAVTILGTAEEQRLVSYVVPEEDPTRGAEDDATAIQRKKRLIEGYRDELGSRLPAYMVPQVYVFMPRLPFTVNGKLDRDALPVPEEGDMLTARYVAPRNTTEEKMCVLWQELLKVARVGVEDNFFLLGGHSLLAARLLNLIRQEFAAELPLRVLFESPTVAALSEKLREAPQTVTLPPVTPVPRDRPLPLSFAQQRLWFIDQLGEGSAQYNMPGGYLLEGEFNVGAFERALQSLLERHEVLRTRYVYAEEAGEPRQVIAGKCALPFELHDLSGLSDEERESEAKRLMREEARAPFDLSRDLMLRVRVLRLSHQHHLILYAMHHIASDGWSLDIFTSELSALYRAYCSGKESPLQPLKIQYADYASWQRDWLSGEILERELAYWKQQLAGIAPVHALPLDRTRPALQSFNARAFRQVLKSTTTARIRALCERRAVTLFMFLETVFAVLLARYGNARDVVVGTPVAGRTHKDVEELIGFFVNVLVLRLDLSGSPTFGDLLRKNRQVILDAYDHQHLPFDLLVEEVQPERRLNYNPLVQIVFALQNNDRGQLHLKADEGEGPGVLTARGLPREEKRTRSDLEVHVHEGTDVLSMSWVYSTALFDDESITRLARNYEVLLQSAMDSLDSESSDPRPFDALGLISEAENDAVLHEWNGRAASIPSERGVQDLFAQQARERPDAVALAYAGQQLTYEELDRRSNILASFLAQKGIHPDVRVGVCLERSMEMIVSLLGIWKAGGCFVPLDPTYPAERLRYLLENAAPAMLLTHSEVLDQLPPCAVELVVLDAMWDEIVERSQGRTDLDRGRSSSRGLAYVIYTSGSTGQPKGVMIEHASACDLASRKAVAFRVDGRSRLLQFASPSFDGSIWEYLMALCSGACLQLASREQMLPGPALTKLLVEKEITHLALPPSALRVLSAEELDERLQTLIVAGEACPADLVKQWASGRMFVNGYGPTEATVGATMHLCDATQDGAPPIGRPIANTRIYIVDRHLRPVPVGVEGEIYIAGAGIARGYLNRAALTAERFVPDPFVENDGARMYRTGDLGRWRAEGTVEFLGRTDDQVKLRGYRIELREIEQRLLELPGVRECAVTILGTAEEQRLVSYVVPEEDPTRGAEDDATAIQRKKRLIEGYRDELGSRLPAYMVPQVYVFMPRLPFTVNGKLDRDALPVPEEGDMLTARYVAPRNTTEEKMCVLWQELLKVARVGVEDNFFLLGGHSLLAARLLNLIRQEFAAELPLRVLFESPTVAALSEKLREAPQTVTLPPVTPVPRDRPLPLSFAQQRLWFIDQLEGSTHYNLPGSFVLRGEFHQDALVQALRTLLDRHEVLRTCFTMIDGEARQVILDDYELPFWRYDLSQLSDDEKAEEVQRLMREELARPFDLSAGVMLRVYWLRLSEDVHLIAHVKHHIVYDHTTGSILERELSELYAAYSAGKPNPLPPLPIQYADYAVWQRELLQGEFVDRGLSYWKRQLAGLPAVHSLPLDKPRPTHQRYRGDVYRQFIGPALAARIAEFNRQHNTTLFMFMHTAFALLLSRWSGERDIVVGGAITGRTHRDVEGLIGFFVNDLVLRLEVKGTPGFAELLQQHRKTILDAYAHQHIPFEMLVEELNPPRNLSYDPLYQIKLDVHHDKQADPVNLETPRGEAAANSGPIQPQYEQNVRHDLHVAVSERRNGLVVSWAFQVDLFAAETIARWGTHFETLLEGIIAMPHESVYRLALLTPVQQQSLLIAGRGPQVTYPHGKCIHQLFEEQVERSPEEPAVVARDGTLTFRQLNEQANRLAHYLLARGAGPGSRVALCTERSIDMVVGLLGILKAGGAYLPLDPAHPPARLEYMLEDSGCRWVLTQGELMSAVSLGERQVLPIDASLRASLLKDYSENDPVLEGRGLTSRHLAYVIYTSGSTGQPKGVMVEHEGVVRYCDHARERYYGSDLAGSLVATSYGFDLTVPALYVPLLAGGHLRLVQEGRELEELAEILVNAPQPYLLRVTPSHVTGMLPLLAGKSSACAHALVIGGEALPVAVVKALRACLPQAKIYNHYGPTEAIVGCSLLPLAESEEQSWNSGYCPIGTALGHKQLLVLNGEMQLQPVGAPGQLYVGGEALSRGYLGQPALTAQKFSSDLFSECVGARLYATGDLVRWRTDGNLEFLGRLDQQVKIRGLRIGLGEIEQGLLELPGVRECAVTVSGVAEQQRLVAYVVPEEDPAKDAEDEAALVQRKARLIEEYREALGSRLPAYMVPQVYVFLPRLPLTLNGKLDREALPAPEESDLVKSRYVAPRNATEQKLCALWQEVLKVAEVGIEDNFFLLGGHSLLATRLLNLIRQEFATELPLRVLFEAPTVAALSERLEDPPTGFALPPVTPVPRDQPLPLSYAQQRLWFIDQLGGGSAQYNVPGSHLLHGPFDVEAFKQAIRSLLERHEVLRTRFIECDGEPRQSIVNEFELPFTTHDLSELAAEEKATRVELLMREEAQRLFDLESDLMLRVRVLKLSHGSHLVLYTQHHIASDGWSRAIFLHELSSLYHAYSRNQPNPLAPLKVQYADYAVWQRGWLHGELLARELEYWEERLVGIAPIHKLPLDHARPTRQSFEGRVYRQRLTPQITARIRALCERYKVTLFIFLETAFAVLLARYGNDSDVVVGTPIAGRMHKDVEGLIGFFVNFLVLRIDVSSSASFGDLLRKNSQIILDAYDHQYLPFEMLVEKIRPERNLNHSPVVQISFAVQNNEQRQLDLGAEAGEATDIAEKHNFLSRQYGHTRFDLEIHVREHADGLSIGWMHNISLFDSESVARLAKNYQVLLQSVIDNLALDDGRECPLDRLKLLSDEEERVLLREWNKSTISFSQEKTVHELFEEQIEKNADSVALVHSGTELTYGELNRRANRLAHYLRERGVRPDTRVGICVERGLAMVVGLLGILKAGGAYVPLDPSYPRERLSYLLGDCEPVLLLVDAAGRAALSDEPLAVALLDLEIDLPFWAQHSSENPRGADLHPHHIAYVIYTSGSTGKPKGVMVEHRNVVRLFATTAQWFHFDARDTWSLFHSMAFDFSVWEIWGALLHGGRLVIVSHAVARSPEEFYELACRERVSVLNQTPSAFTHLMEAQARSTQQHALRRVIFGGEALQVRALKRWYERHGDDEPLLVNMYGITETCVHVTYQALRSPDAARWMEGSPIGTRLPDLRVYLLDAELRQVPIGVTGEIYVGGAGVTRGYLNRPPLTSTRFVPDPFSSEPGSRLYRAGDMGRFRADGSIEYLGRNDQQVKIRGYRIELGEIEAALNECEQLANAVVSVGQREGVEPQLIAYVCPTADLLDSTAEESNRSVVAQWSSVFDETYGESNQPADSDFSGWKSSYTGDPIPVEQMREWLAGTLELIEGLKPKRLLEIGCGTGLLLFRYGMYCDAVDATDISAAALSGVRKELERRGWTHVRLLQGDAASSEAFGDARYDTVVLNSVVQYFPNRQYLENVIVGALRRLEDGGRILLGDLRNMDLFEAHVSAVEHCRMSESTRVSVLSSRVQRRMQLEPELLVSPSYFTRLPERFPDIGRVDVLVKCGASDNEMQRYRYEVVLTKGRAQPAEELRWKRFESFERTSEWVSAGEERFGVWGVPNGKVEEHVSQWKGLMEWPARRLVHPLEDRGRLSRAAEERVRALKSLQAQAQANGYSVGITWSRERPDQLDVLFSRGQLPAVQARNGYVSKPSTNCPQLARVGQRLSEELPLYLQERLPEYMIPRVYVALERLPLTVNGKVDRRALPQPEESDLVKLRYVEPRNATEEKMCALWQDLLKVGRVGIQDNFFLLGGHSLLAARLVNMIRQEFATELPLRALFESPTIAALSEKLVEAPATRPLPPLVAAPRDQPLPLSYAQQRLWFIDQLGEGSAQYNMAGSYQLEGEFNLHAFERALHSLLERHEPLRTHFVEQDGEPRQVIAEQYTLPLQVHDLSVLNEQERVREVKRLMREEARAPFDLGRDLMLRVRVLKLSEKRHLILHTVHHIASDGWSQGIFKSELGTLYGAYSTGKENPLAPLPFRYADYAVWQRRWLQGPVLEQQTSYWQEQLRGLPSLLALPTDRPRPAVQTLRGSKERFALPAPLLQKLQTLSREQGATLYMTLLSAFAVLLGRYSGQQDLAVGTPIANRRRRETEGLIGFLLNTLVMRHDLRGDPCFVDLLKRTREMALQAYAHQDVPFEKLVEELNPERSLSHSPLFQVMFILQNMPLEALELPGLEVRALRADGDQAGRDDAQEGTARFDLTLSMQESASGLVGALEYNTDLFERSTIWRMLGHYTRLLEGVVSTPEARLSRLEMLGGDEKRQQLLAWNATGRAYPHLQCVHELFEAQVLQAPDRIALVHEGSKLTYAELNRRANRLAHQLIERGVGPEVRVGLCMPRSVQMVIGILGILKAGGVYVPLDPEYPRKRLEFVLEDAQIDLVVTEPSVALGMTGPGRDMLLLTEADTLDPSANWMLEDVDGRALGLCPDHPAYLIYTSASTGTPKGVVGLHRSIVNRVNWLANSLGVGAEEVLCQKTSVGFVDHVAEIFQALSVGVPLVIISPSVLQSPQELLRELDARGVTQLTLVPSLLKSVLEAGQGERARRLKSIYSSGEALHLSGLEKLSECFPQARLFNIYGSTEMGADVTCQEVAAERARAEGAGEWAPIGKGIDNTELYVLDADGQLVVSGAVGELYVGGVCLARGYFRQAGLTAERFVPHPFSEPGARVYRTGDLARWLADGTLEYLGRVDHQVKVRGFRIELGEIESVLLAHEAVRAAVVVVREETGDKRLVGYVVAEPAARGDDATLIQELRSRVQQQLPGYMVPSAFVILESLPLTASGKIDRKALPAPGKDLAKSNYEPPRNEFESRLCELWRELLKLERVGIQDNFFDSGGHSLLAITLRTRIAETTGVNVTVTDIYANPTIASLADALKAAALIQQDMDPVVFMFPDRGLRRGAGQGLYENGGTFRAAFDECAERAKGLIDVDIRQSGSYALPHRAGSDAAADSVVNEVALFALEYSLARHCQSLDLEPETMVGIGTGEYVAACLSGVFSLEDALALVVIRARTIGELAKARARGDARINEIIQAFHRRLAETKLHVPGKPYLSSTTAKATREEVADKKYWLDHLASPALFSSCVEELLGTRSPKLLELGPGDHLTRLAKLHGVSVGACIISLLGSANAAEQEVKALTAAIETVKSKTTSSRTKESTGGTAVTR